MSELFSQLGINVPALLAQAANFAVVLLVLTYVVYRPLMKIVADRRRTIEKGLEDAEGAAVALASAEKTKADRIADAESQAFGIVQSAQGSAKKEGEKVLHEMQVKAEAVLANAMRTAEREKQESLAAVEAEAREFVRRVVEKTVAMNPSAVDASLVGQAVAELKKAAL